MFNQLINQGNLLYQYPVSVGNNFWADEMAFNQAFADYASQVSLYLAAITPMGQLPFGFDQNNPNTVHENRQEMFGRTNEAWLQTMFGASASASTATQTSANASFDLAATNTIENQFTQAELPRNTLITFDNTEGFTTAGVYEIGDPGDTADTILSFGELDDDTLIALESIGGEDAIDIFHFNISENQTFAAVLDNLAGDVDLALFDANGEFLAISENVGTEMESFAVDLTAGDHYLGMVSYDGVATDYNLGITLSDPLNTFEMAVDSNNDVTGQQIIWA